MRRLSRATWITLAKIGLVVVLAYVLYRQLWGGAHWETFLAFWTTERWQENRLYLLFTLLLMPLNWTLETAKWWVLLRPLYPSPFAKAFIAVLNGISLSLFTPHRIGEYGGRILNYPAVGHTKVIMASLVANFGQLLCLISAGFIGIIFWGRSFFQAFGIVYDVALYVGGPILVFLWWGFFSIRRFLPWIQRISWPTWLRWVPKTLEHARQFNKILLVQSAAMAAIRFLIYSIQFVCLLLFFGLDVPWHILLNGVFVIYLLQSGLPLPPALGLLTRGELGVLIWQNYEVNPLAILAASIALFIINLAIPALLGLMVIVKTNVTKSLQYVERAD